MTIEYQFPKADPQLRDLLDRVGIQISQNLNCLIIGRIESFDKAKNTITASSSFKRKYSDGTIVEFPLFADVPIITLSGGNSFLSMPIKKGDWCLLFFSDRDIDSWWYSGEITEPNSPRHHALGDAIALVGLRPQNAPIELSDTQVILNGGDVDLVLKTNNGQIVMSAFGKAKIANQTQSLKIILDSILAALETLAVDPGTHIILPITVTALNQAKANLALLMEE